MAKYASNELRERLERHYESEPTSGCWLWTGCTNRGGYGWIGSREHGRSILAHRASWEVNRGLIPDGLLVLHRCDNPPCVNPEHLFLGTYLDNARDRKEKGRSRPRIGELHGRSKLKEEDVRRIREMIGDVQQREIAKMFGVSQSLIHAIKSRRIWQNVA